MQSRPCLAILFASSLLLAPFARANALADITKAQIYLGQVQQTVSKIQQLRTATAATTTAPALPAPVTGNAGKFYSPYKADGSLTEWAQKALGAQVGAALGAKAGEKVGGMAASKIPLAGGFLAMGAKKKGKELGALAAVGGPDFMKQSSDCSFNSLPELSTYMHLKFAGNADYVKAFAATLAVYPDLEKTYENAVKQAYSGR